jgi:hypothetical protein
VTSPVKPIVNALGRRIPALSDLVHRDITLANLAEIASQGAFGVIAGGRQQSCSAFVKSVKDMIEFGDDLDNMINGQTGIIAFGDFVFKGDARPTEKEHALTKRMDDASDGTATNEGEIDNDWVVDGEEEKPDDNGDDKLKNIKSKSQLTFPLFKQPKLLLDVIKGKDIALVEWHSPRITVDYFIDFHINMYVVNVDFTGWFLFDGGVIVGYDTFGIRQALKTRNPLEAINGFYLDVSQPQIVLQGGLAAGLGLDVFIARAYAYGIIIIIQSYPTNSHELR